MKEEYIGLLKPYGFALKLQQIDPAIKREKLLESFTLLFLEGRRALIKHRLVFCLSNLLHLTLKHSGLKYLSTFTHVQL